MKTLYSLRLGSVSSGLTVILGFLEYFAPPGLPRAFIIITGGMGELGFWFADVIGYTYNISVFSPRGRRQELKRLIMGV